MLVSTSCGHCHAMNPLSVQRCRECGHDAHRSRMECSSPRCHGRGPCIPLGGTDWQGNTIRPREGKEAQE
jgi:hypothetical protein